MIAIDSPCLTDDQLRDLAAGRLPGDRFRRLLEHLDDCRACQQRAEQAETPDDSLVAALGSPMEPDPHAAESDCVAALHLCSRPHENSAQTSTPPVEQLGAYRLIRPLGRGGMGAVFLAHHVRLKRQCAIKLLKAVVALSSDDGFGDDDELIDRGGRAADAESKRAAVAASMLRAARRFGGLRSSGPGIMTTNIISPSEQFMGHLLAFYPATLPNPGLAAISQELEIGNEKSRMASIWILSSYVGGSFDGPHQPEFGELDRWSRTVEGREELRELSDHIDQAVEALGGYASPALQDVHRGQSGMPQSSHERELSQAELAYQPRLKINELLEVDSWRDPAISGRLQRSVESARQSTQAWFESVELHGGVEGDPTGPRWLSKPEVAAALNALDAAEGTLDADAAAWAVVPSLLTSYHDHEEPDAARLVLQQLAEVAPVATADAILSLMIARGFYLASTSGGFSGITSGGFSGMMSMGGGMGGMGGMGGGVAGISNHFGNEKLWSLAMEIVGRSTTQPRLALGLLQEKHGQFQGFQKQELAKSPDLEASMVAAIRQLEARVNPVPAP